MNYRNKANLTLLGVSIGFLFSIAIGHFFGKNFYTEMLMTIMEAALVGGAADWFAITAIYSKPLGVAYHTEIVPKNREKIIESISNFVENDLLSASSLESRIDKIKLCDRVVELSKNKKAYIEGRILQISNYIVSSVGEKNLEGFIFALREKYIYRLNTVKLIKDTSGKIYESKSNEILDFVIDIGIDFLNSEKGTQYIYDIIYKIKQEKTSGFFSRIGLAMMGKTENDVVDIDSLTAIFVEKAIEKLRELKEEDNSYRIDLHNAIKAYIDNIDKYEDELEKIKNYIVRDSNIKVLIQKLFSVTTVDICREEKESTTAALYLFEILKKVFYNVLENKKVLCSIETAVKKLVIKLIDSKHYIIGKMVRDTLNEFDNNKLNAFIDNKVGDDLQWIRINGSVVGSFIGFIIFLIVYFIYNPYIVPFIRRIF
ncbi:DUF445 family protein [Clostridium neuense]|uniref:DUF445 family protein n=1 Tax=Clostridium neuense TaxID=1728934 RepID=A0ABW8TMX9_9CLOT